MASRAPLSLAILALGFAAGWSSSSSADPAGEAKAPTVVEPGAEVAIPAGMPVGLDGQVLAAEWEDSPVLLFSREGPALRVKVSRGTLLLALVTDRAWPAGAVFRLWARAGDADGSIGDPGTVQVDFEATEHNRPHVIVQVRTATGWERKDGAAVFRAKGLDVQATAEGAIPLALMGVVPTDPAAPPRPLRWLAFWSRPGRAPSHVTIPAGLDAGAVSQGLPPALRSSASWARTTTWADARGPGAWSATEWATWVAYDRELAERGAKAYGMAMTLREGGEEGGKKDATIEKDLVENLKWIAGREPLTGDDLRVLATGLWRLNRTDEALGVLDGYGLSPAAATDHDVFFLRGFIAFDAERFAASEEAFRALARRLGERLGASYVTLANRSRDTGKAFETEVAARKADAEKGDLPLVLLRTTKGEVVIRLLEDDAPESAKQFVHLVEETKGADGKPFYEGTCFHRVVANGLVQGGDPRSRTEGCDMAGAGGSPWWIPAEATPSRGFFRGSIGWAMASDRKVRSQFFVMTAPKPTITQNGFTCFATVVSGMDVIDRMETGDLLLSLKVLSKRDHPYLPKKNY